MQYHTKQENMNAYNTSQYNLIQANKMHVNTLETIPKQSKTSNIKEA